MASVFECCVVHSQRSDWVLILLYYTDSLKQKEIVLQLLAFSMWVGSLLDMLCVAFTLQEYVWVDVQSYFHGVKCVGYVVFYYVLVHAMLVGWQHLLLLFLAVSTCVTASIILLYWKFNVGWGGVGIKGQTFFSHKI